MRFKHARVQITAAIVVVAQRWRVNSRRARIIRGGLVCGGVFRIEELVSGRCYFVNGLKRGGGRSIAQRRG